MDEIMLGNLTFRRPGMGGGLGFLGRGRQPDQTKTKFYNAQNTCANTPNRVGWGRFGAGIN